MFFPNVALSDHARLKGKFWVFTYNFAKKPPLLPFL